MDIEQLEENTVCDVILEYTGVAFAKKNFQVDWRVAQIRVHPPPKQVYPEQYMFQDD